MSDAVRRAIRTFLDAFIGVWLLAAVPALNKLVQDLVSSDGNKVNIDLNFYRNVLLAAVVAGFIALLNFVKNWLEDNTRWPALLKSVPSGGKNPVTVDPPK